MNIAIICAPQTFGCNTGMYSVDLAAWCFFRKHFPQACVRFFTLYPSPGDFGHSPFVYEGRLAFDAWEDACDIIFYWGDFLHSWAYRQAMIKWLMQHESDLSREEAIRIIRCFLYRLHQPENTRPRVLLYGGTVLFNRWSDYSDTDYQHDLTGLLKRASAIWMREPFSSAVVQYLTGNYQLAQGTDCALLLNQSVLAGLSDQAPVKSAEQSVRGRVGVFLGRSHIAARRVADLLETLTMAAGLYPCWLHWGHRPFFLEREQDLLVFFPDLPRFPPVSTPIEALSALLTFDCIISDTYHVCVNAWNLGVPAICLLDDVSGSLDVNDGGLATRDKRLMFYGHYNLEPFIVYASEIQDTVTCQRKVNSLITALNDSRSLQLVLDALRNHASACEAQLVRSIQ